MEIEQDKFLDKITEFLKKGYTKEIDLSKLIVFEKSIEFSKVEGKQNQLSDGFHNFTIIGNLPEKVEKVLLEKIQFNQQLQRHALMITVEMMLQGGVQVKTTLSSKSFPDEKQFAEIFDRLKIRALRESLEKQQPPLINLNDVIFPQTQEPLNLKTVWNQEGQFITEAEALQQQKQLKEERKSVLGFLAQKKKVRLIEKEMLIHGKQTTEPRENLQTGLRQELGEQQAQQKSKLESEQKKKEKEVQQVEEKAVAPDIPEEEVKKLQEFVQFYKENDIEMRANIDTNKRDISQLKGHFEEEHQSLKKRPYIGMGSGFQQKQENLRNAMEQQQAVPQYDPIDMLNVPMEGIPKQYITNVQQFPNTNKNSFLDNDFSQDIIKKERQKKTGVQQERQQIQKPKKEAQKEVNIDQFKGLQFDFNTIQELKEQKQMNN